MNKKYSLVISGILAITIYISLIGLLFFYFNSFNKNKSLHYVKKNKNSIRIKVATFKTKKITINNEKKRQKINPKRKKEKKIHKKVIRKKIIRKKIVRQIKKKIKKVIEKKIHSNLNKPKDLFKNITSETKLNNNKIKKITASELVSSSIKIQKKSDKGIENSYLASIEEKLNGWPAQSNYAGEKANVWFKIEVDGSFIFKVTTASVNEEFNRNLISYLKQLQKIGFGRHKGRRSYTLDVEFIATE